MKRSYQVRNKGLNALLKKALQTIAFGTLCSMCLFAQLVPVFAQGGIFISTESLDMYVSDERQFTVYASNAVGSIDISSSNEDIAVVDIDNVWLDNDSAVITVNAKKVGECDIYVNVVDGATYDEEEISSVYTIHIKVSGELGPQKVNVPYADVPSGEVTEGTLLALNCVTPDAVIHYSFNEGEFAEYEDKIFLSKDLLNDEGVIKLELYASKKGNYLDSEHVYYSYEITDMEEDYGQLLPEDAEMYEDISKIPEGFWISGIKDYEYTGKAIKQEGYRVYYHTTLLKEKTDYAVSYRNNTKVGADQAMIIISGRGNYAGSFSETYSITAIDLSEAKAEDQILKYNGKPQNVPSKVMLDGKTLKKNTDYSLSLEKAQEIGKYTVVVSGKGNYKGSVSYIVEVGEKKPISEVSCLAVKNISYTGEEYRPEVVFKEYTFNKNKIQLQEGVDYTVEYDADCKSAGAHSIFIKATDTSEYVFGTKVLTYKITGIPLSTYNNADLAAMTYTGEEIYQRDPRLYKKVKVGNTTVKEYLEAEGNYTIRYTNNIKSGSATVTYTGIGPYSGTIRKTFKISQFVLTDRTPVTISMDSSYDYVKGGVMPEPIVNYKGIQLIKDVDYKLSYKNNNKVNDNSGKTKTALTITGKGNFTGKIERQFAITAKDIKDVLLIVDDCLAGKAKASVKLTDVNGKSLSSSDYYISNLCYNENVKLSNGKQRYKGETINSFDQIPPGKVLKVYIRGKGSYTGSTSALFKTCEKKISSASAAITSQAYTGKPVTLSKDDITLKIGKDILTKNDYDIIAYKNNVNKGKAVVTIRGKGGYGGTKDIKFTIADRTMNLKIRFDGNGASSGKMSDQSISAISALRTNAFKKTGYTFGGWSLTKDGTKVYSDKQNYPYTAADAGKTVTLFAVWIKTAG